MSSAHGSKTVIKIDTDVLTGCNTSTLTRGGDSHDTTQYGDTDHVVSGGLGTGSFSCGGWYDNTASTGNAAVLKPLINTVTPVTRQCEGTGSGKPQEVFDALLTSYVETNPVADIVTWSADFTISGPVNDAPQSP